MTSESRKAVTAVGVAVLLIAVFLVGRATAPSLVEERDEVTPPTDSLQTEEGAIDAASEFARVLPGPSGDVDAYIQAMSEIAAPEWQERAQELANNAVDFVADRYGGDESVSFEPVRYRVGSYSRQEAEVSIWGVVLATSSDSSSIEESWLTTTLNLVWVNDQWKLSGQSSQGGPTPELLRTNDGMTVDQLSGFEEFESVESP